MKRAITICLSSFLLSVSPARGQDPEQIKIITDKQWYYPGETLWFSLNVINACNGKTSSQSAVAYVELLSSDNKPVHQARVAVENANGNSTFPINANIPSGTYQLVAYTSWMKNFGEGLYSTKQLHIINPAGPENSKASYNMVQEMENNRPGSASISTSKKLYNKREKVSLQIKTARPGPYAVSVMRLNRLENGTSDNPLMQTEACAAKLRVPTLHAIEKRGQIVSCRIFDKISLRSLPGVRAYLSIIGSPNDLFVATSDSMGIARFEIGNIDGGREVALQTDPAVNRNTGIEIMNVFSGSRVAPSKIVKQISLDVSDADVNDAMITSQVMRIFGNNKNNTAGANDDKKSYPFYGKPDAFYLISDYVQFTTVEEILREYVTAVGVQRRKGKAFPFVFDVLSQKVFNEKPLILIDGVPEFDHERLMNLSTADFFSIAVVGRKYVMGHELFHGIIDIRLSAPLTSFGNNVTLVDYEGISPEHSFSSPSYTSPETLSSRKPDFRTLLYWNPFMETDEKGQASVDFYTSDLDGEFAVVVTGIGGEVGLISSKTTFTVE